MCELGHGEGRAQKNGCFRTVVLEKTLESPLNSKDMKPVNLKVNQPWVLIEMTDVKTPILYPHDANNWLTGKDTDAGKEWRQKKKIETEDEMVGWHHWFNGQELGQTLGDGKGQGSLACCSPWGHKESNTTWQLKNNIVWEQCAYIHI